MSNQNTDVKVNKHGLSRTIPAEVKTAVRQQDGYGCVICGKMLVDYEHIDPLFCDATEHNAEHIALLCSEHHDQVTRRILPKRIIKEHKAKPYCKQRGFADSRYFPHPNDIKIKCGTSYFQDTKKIIEINGKPIIWIEDEEDQILFNAIFYDNEGNKVGYLNKNTFIALVKDCDIYAVASRIEARLKKGIINLQLDIEADGIVDIKRLSAKYGGTKININNKGEIYVDSHGSTVTFSNLQTYNCGGAISLGGIPKAKGIFFKLNKVMREKLKIKMLKIRNLNGTLKGYIYQNQIINLDNLTTGYIQENKVYNLLDEHVGNLIKSNLENSYTIEIENDEYEDREPIYVQEKNRIINKILEKPTVDTSYRILEN